MIVVQLDMRSPVLSVKDAADMLAKYDDPQVRSGEDFNGVNLFSYVIMVAFKTEEEAFMFMLEASRHKPHISNRQFASGHRPF